MRGVELGPDGGDLAAPDVLVAKVTGVFVATGGRRRVEPRGGGLQVEHFDWFRIYFKFFIYFYYLRQDLRFKSGGFFLFN